MRKLLKYLGEYFLGTETRKFYREERSWYREFITDPKDLRKSLRSSRMEEGVDLIAGKIVPNIADIFTLTYSTVTNNPPYGLIFAEALRLNCTINFNKRKRKKEFSRNLSTTLFRIGDGLNESINKLENSIDKLEDLTDRLDDEGEDWKKL